MSLSIKILSDFGTGINCTWCCVFHLSQVKLDPVTVCKLQFNYGVILFTKPPKMLDLGCLLVKETYKNWQENTVYLNSIYHRKDNGQTALS